MYVEVHVVDLLLAMVGKEITTLKNQPINETKSKMSLNDAKHVGVCVQWTSLIHDSRTLSFQMSFLFTHAFIRAYIVYMMNTVYWLISKGIFILDMKMVVRRQK